jgi:hypothetical protein
MKGLFKLQIWQPQWKAAWLGAFAAGLILTFAVAQPAQFQNVPAQQPSPNAPAGNTPAAGAPVGNTPWPATPPSAQTSPLQPPAHKPGAMEAFGRWFDDSAANMRRGFDEMWKGMGSASQGTADVAGAMTKGTVDAAKGTVDALGKLGGSRIVSGREKCLLAPNGAPDCQAAAIRICKAAGFNTGSSADFVTSEECPASAYANGRKPKPGECPVESVVIKAVCSQ